jgi:hypothetical protein
VDVSLGCDGRQGPGTRQVGSDLIDTARPRRSLVLGRLRKPCPHRQLAPAAYPRNPGSTAPAPIQRSSTRLSIQVPALVGC